MVLQTSSHFWNVPPLIAVIFDASNMETNATRRYAHFSKGLHL